MMGGRHRKGHKTRKGRKMRGGVMVGFGNDHISPGNAERIAVDTSTSYNSATGRPGGDPNPTTTSVITGGKRRKSRKGKSKKSKKSMRRSRASRGRKMRGGMYPGIVNSAPVSAGFVGGLSGVSNGTYGTYVGSPQKVPAGNPHPVGPDGVTKV